MPQLDASSSWKARPSAAWGCQVGTAARPRSVKSFRRLPRDGDAVAARRTALGRRAATAMAALSGAYVPAPGERVAVVVCGADTDPATLGRPTVSPVTVGRG